MAWYYELRDSQNHLVFFGGGCQTREKAEETAQSVKKMMPSDGKLTTGCHQDESAIWVADPSCGHTQHVRHRPPWESRRWVTTIEGWEQHVGRVFVYKICGAQCDPRFTDGGNIFMCRLR